MAILAGIDEAGFGPLLGPLVVSGVAFRVPDDLLGTCLWDKLSGTCAKEARGAGRRLLVADSKKLYHSGAGLAQLERAALVMLALGGHRPASLRALLKLVAPTALEDMEQYAWYTGADVGLPLSDGVGDIGTRANALRRNCAEHRIEFLDVFSEILLAGHYNRLVRNTRNKAVVLLGMALRVVDRVLRRVGGQERVRLCVDRLGGRTHYREPLSMAMPGYDLHILEESDRRSAYRLVRRPRVCEIEFVTGGDSHRFPTALASIYSKYLRELYMHVFNAFWSGKMNALRPTAGYYSDAQRWLQDTSPLLEEMRVDRGLLVRLR